MCVCVPSFFLFFKETNSVDFFLLGVRLTESVSNQMDWFTEFFSLDWVFGGSACSKKNKEKPGGIFFIRSPTLKRSTVSLLVIFFVSCYRGSFFFLLLLFLNFSSSLSTNLREGWITELLPSFGRGFPPPPFAPFPPGGCAGLPLSLSPWPFGARH